MYKDPESVTAATAGRPSRRNKLKNAVVGLSRLPQSTAYSAAARGPQALTVRMLRKQQPLFHDVPPNQKSLPAGFHVFWLATEGAVLVRVFDFGDDTLTCERDLNLWANPRIGAADLPAKFIEHAKVIAAARVACKFRWTKSGTRIPREPRTKVEIEEANDVAERLYSLAQSNPHLVQIGVEYYINHVDSDNLLVVSSSQVREVSDWLSMVRALKQEIQVVAYEMAGEDRPQNAVSTLLGQLGFPKRYINKVVWRRARNRGYVGRIGLHVVCEYQQGTKVRSSEGFRFVMASAAIAKIWSLPTVLDPRVKLAPLPHSGGQGELFSSNDCAAPGDHTT